MAPPGVPLPGPVRAKAELAGAHAWLRGLARTVADIEREWRIRVGRSYPDATEALVAEAVTEDGTPAVLKLHVPRPGDHAAHEATVLRLAGGFPGAGCARLLAHDAARDALLLERLGPALSDLGLPFGRRLDILCDLAGRVWRPAPDAGLPTGRAKAGWLAGFIEERWARLDRPCTERTVEHALACARRRGAAHDDERAVLVHGDVHQWNALRVLGGPDAGRAPARDAKADGFRLVDPDGLLAEPEYDLGVLMREDPVELLAGDPRERSRRLAARTGRSEPAIWEWGVVERVSTGLLLTEIGVQPVGREMLAAADTVAARPG